jgi:nickel-dependent lactate racemase
LYTFLDALGEKEDVMIVPPDFTRFHSQSGKITRMIAEYYNFIKRTHNSSNFDEKDAIGDTNKQDERAPPKMEFIPALGTHAPMTKEQIKIMFGDELAAKDPSPFLVHDWRNDVVTIGHAPSEMVSMENEYRG